MLIHSFRVQNIMYLVIMWINIQGLGWHIFVNDESTQTVPAVKHHGMHYYSCVEKKNIFAKGNMGLLVKVKFNTLINYSNYKNNLFRDNLETNHSYISNPNMYWFCWADNGCTSIYCITFHLTAWDLFCLWNRPFISSRQVIIW